MAETYYSKALGARDEEGQIPLSLMQGMGGVEFSARREPMLALARAVSRLENTKKMMEIIEQAEKERRINPRLSTRAKIVLIGQVGQDGIFAALDKATATEIMIDDEIQMIHGQALSYPWDAYNETYTAIEKQRQIHATEMFSRAMRDDFNERRYLANVQTTNIFKQEINDKRLEPKKGGLLGSILRKKEAQS